MLLDKVLADINEEYNIVGTTGFDTLALIGTNIESCYLTYIDTPRYVSKAIENCVVMTLPEIAPKLNVKGICICKEPRLLFFKVHNFLSNTDDYRRSRFATTFGNNCSISPLSCISTESVRIGDNAVIEEFVSIKENTVIGNNCTIRAGSIIGGDGFEYKRDGDTFLSIMHLGGVVIGDNVEIKQLCSVHKAVYPWDDTIIGDHCKIDNLVHIAHGVKLNARVLIVTHTSVSGRTIVGNDVWIGPKATVTNNVRIGDNARVNIGAVVVRNVADHESVTGNFAMDHERFVSNYIVQSRRKKD